MFLVVTRMRDTAFKRVLETLAIGSQVKIESSFGTWFFITIGPETRRFWLAWLVSPRSAACCSEPHESHCRHVWSSPTQIVGRKMLHA